VPRRIPAGWQLIPTTHKGLPISSINYVDDKRDDPVAVCVTPEEAIEEIKKTRKRRVMRQRIGNASSDFQGDYKRVLCLCSAGMLRSPTAAVVLSQKPYNFNTRSAGLNPNYALNVVDSVLISWADEIVVMEPEMLDEIRRSFIGVLGSNKRIVCLNIPDRFSYRDADLMAMIRQRYDDASP